MRALRGTGVLALALALVASAAGADPPLPRPPGQHPAANASGDEAGIWYASNMAEDRARASGERDSDAALAAYVKQVECKVAPEYCGELRVYVMDRPFFNAMAAPNGYIEVWTGTLLRARNEAELAFILAHETTHYAYDHSLVAHRRLQQQMNALLPIGMLAAPFVGALVLDIGYLGAIAGFEHYSREQELEADKGGFARLVAAGYSAAAAPAVWHDLIDEQSRSIFDKVRQQHARAGLFDDHPLEGERLDALATLAKGATGGDLGQARFRDAIRPHLAAFLRDDLRRRDYGETLFVIDQLRSDGGDAGVLAFFSGECYRLRRQDGDEPKAIAAYVEASAQPDAPPEAWRNLGDLYLHQHEAAKARAAYQAYLDHAPAAQDRWLVEAALKKLDQSGGT